MRKSPLALLILVSFLSVAVFGFVAMMPDDSHGHSACLAALSKGALCSTKTQATDEPDIAFHLGIFKSFSTAVLTLTALAGAIAIFLILTARNRKTLFVAIPFSTIAMRIILHETLRRARLPILRFCALHEKRDPELTAGAFG